MRRFFSILTLVLLTARLFAQDIAFTQFYFAPVYLNPALTGCSKSNLRLSGVTKMQWFNLYKPYKYAAVAADYSIYDDFMRNICNLGLAVNHSTKGYLSKTNISGIVGRSFGVSNVDCSNWTLSLAIQAGYTLSRVNPNQFVFADQIDQTGITGVPSQVDLFTTFTNKNYFDMSSGFIYTWDKFMFGGSVHHLNEPNLSFSGKPDDGRLPRKYSGHVSYIYDNGDVKFKPTVIAEAQGKSSVFTLGTLIDFNEFPIQIGCWYRNAVGLTQNSSFNVGFNWKWGEMTTVTSRTKEYGTKMGVSYDAELYKPGLNTTHGSLEFGIQRDIIVNDNGKCPTSSSGACSYKYPWEFF